MTSTSPSLDFPDYTNLITTMATSTAEPTTSQSTSAAPVPNAEVTQEAAPEAVNPEEAAATDPPTTTATRETPSVTTTTTTTTAPRTTAITATTTALTTRALATTAQQNAQFNESIARCNNCLVMIRKLRKKQDSATSAIFNYIQNPENSLVAGNTVYIDFSVMMQEIMSLFKTLTINAKRLPVLIPPIVELNWVLSVYGQENITRYSDIGSLIDRMINCGNWSERNYQVFYYLSQLLRGNVRTERYSVLGRRPFDPPALTARATTAHSIFENAYNAMRGNINLMQTHGIYPRTLHRTATSLVIEKPQPRMSSPNIAPENVVGAENSNGDGSARGQKRRGDDVGNSNKRQRNEELAVEEQEERRQNEQPAEVAADGVVGDGINNDEVVAEKVAVDDPAANKAVDAGVAVDGGGAIGAVVEALVDRAAVARGVANGVIDVGVAGGGAAVDGIVAAGVVADAAANSPAALKRQFKKQLADVPQPNFYPNQVRTQNPRTELVDTAQANKKILRSDHICFVCGEDETLQRGRLEKCEGKLGMKGCKKAACPKLMHLECARTYNAGALLIPYALQQQCQYKLLCSDHVCRACDMSNMKQTAYDHELLHCKVCISAYHTACVPAGTEIETIKIKVEGGGNTTLQMIICPTHLPRAAVQQHFPVCRCGGSSRGATRCSTCPQVVHARCREVRTVDDVDVGAGTCDDCAQKVVIRNEALVIVWHGTKFEQGVTKQNEGNGRVNVKLVKTGETIVAELSDMFLMKEHYINAAPTLDRELWKQQFEDDAKKTRFVPTYKKVKKVVKTLKKLGRGAEMEIMREECQCTGTNRCTDISQCDNLQNGVECPESCGECGNRQISNFKVNPKMELFEAGNKGLGVRAKEPILKGEYLAEFAGEVIDEAEHTRRKSIKRLSKDKEAHYYAMELVAGLYIDAATHGNIARYCNHSCAPNAYFEKKGVFRSSKFAQTTVYLEAVKDIEVDHEITLSYPWTTEFFKCRCNKCEAEEQEAESV